MGTFSTMIFFIQAAGTSTSKSPAATFTVFCPRRPPHRQRLTAAIGNQVFENDIMVF